jgi:hypothetical protein
MLEKECLGKELKYGKSLVLSGGHHFWKHQHLIIDYDYAVDRMAKTITFDGTVKYNVDYIKNDTRLFGMMSGDCEFRVLFADQTNKVIAVETFNAVLGPNYNVSTPFVYTLPYDNRYSSVLVAYFIRTTYG